MRLNLCSGKGNQGSVTTQFGAASFLRASCVSRRALCPGMAERVWASSLLGGRKRARRPGDSECPQQGDLLSLEEEREKGVPVAALHSCLKENHKDCRTKACVVAAGVEANGQWSRVATWEVQVEHE